jgi:3-oxoacyl-[acyl-carrier-protein] synthase-3
LEDFNNLGGASIPSLMVTHIADKLRKEPSTILGSSFGLGLSWGTMLLKTKPMVVPDLVILS